MNDALDYIDSDKTLVLTNRLGPEEYGASQVVARDVGPLFGLWAQETWRVGDASFRHPDLGTAAVRERIPDLGDAPSYNSGPDAWIAVIALAAIDMMLLLIVMGVIR